MKWEDFKKYVEDSNKHQNAVKTGIQCPRGLRRMKRRISITIPEEIYQLIHEYAAERECTQREIIIEALTEYLDQIYHFPDLEEEEIEMNEEKKHTIAVEMETKGFEEAGEKIEVIADALDQMPATINLKAKDCEINIHNSIWIDRREENELEEERPGFKTTAIGGVIEETGKAEEESERKPITVIPRDRLNRALTRMIARSIKESCAKEGCATCPFKNMEDGPYCELTGARPADWKI